MRHSEQVTNFAQNLGELVGHDILLAQLSDPAERDKVKAEVGTEHVALEAWFRTVVAKATVLLGRAGTVPDEDACCRSLSRFDAIAHPSRVGQTHPASRHAHAVPSFDDHVDDTTHS